MATPYKSPDVTPYLVVIPRLDNPALIRTDMSCVPLAHSPRGKYNSLENPCISLRSHSFQLIQGELTRGLAGIYSMPTSMISLLLSSSDYY